MKVCSYTCLSLKSDNDNPLPKACEIRSGVAAHIVHSPTNQFEGVFQVNKSIMKTLMGSTIIAGSIAGAASFAPAASAQSVDEVVVTGSRIARKDISSVSPLAITDAETIKFSGFTRIEDLTNSLPQIEASNTSFEANGATGTASIDLRGIGTNRTLVLINGRRMQPGNINTNAPDISQIPSALVERVEVVTGGASSTYGADAVAGVVNYIMKTDFEGVDLTVGTSFYQHNNDNKKFQGLLEARDFDFPTGSVIDGEQYTIDFTAGKKIHGGRGHITGYATYVEDKELRQEARDYSSCALNGAGTACGGSANAIVPNFDFYPVLDGEVDFDFNSFAGLTSDNGFVADDGTNRYNFAPVNHFKRPTERYTLGGFAEYDFTDRVQGFAEVGYANSVTAGQIAESGTFFAEEYRFSLTDPRFTDAQRTFLQTQLFNSDDEAAPLADDGEFVAYIGKRNVEGGPRKDNLESEALRLVGGVRGDITADGRFGFEASMLYATTDSSSFYENDFLLPALATALSPDCGTAADPECLSYDVFTFGGVTPEAAASIGGTALLTGTTEQIVMNAFATGEVNNPFMADSVVQGVLGFELRKEGYETNADRNYSEGLLLGQGGATPSIRGSYEVAELFGELLVPVFDSADIGSLELELGGRLSDFSTTGDSIAYKVGANWDMNETTKLRASYNRANRAPNVRELFTPTNEGLWSGTDACAGDEPTYTLEQCLRTGVTESQYGNVSASPAGQYNGLFGGNVDLEQEEADTYSFGAVLRPIPGMVLSADYWSIEMSNLISTELGASVIEKCGVDNDQSACALINRSPAGNLWLGNDGRVTLTNQNLGGLEYAGIDLAASYGFDALGGEFNFTGVGTMMTQKYTESTDADCVGVVSENCFPSPRWRSTTGLSYSRPDAPWTLKGIWRTFSAVEYDGDTDIIIGEGFDAQNYFDLKATYQFNDHIGALVGVNNIMDDEPPFVGNTLGTNANTYAGFYEPLGRYVHASVSFTY